ncbi:MAG: class I SAM-dependent methyltransferase [Promethearchaeota archaeon]
MGGGITSHKDDDFIAAKKLIQEQFGREAEKYVSSRVHSNVEDLEWVLNFIEPKLDWYVLDIATGAGHLALTLAPKVDRIIASDITQMMLDKATRLASERNVINLKTQIIDVHDIPFADNTFDLVTVRIAPHHFYDMERAIQEMIRTTKLDGFIFIQDTVSPEDRDSADFINHLEKLRDPSHIRTLSKSQWEDLLKRNGCKVIKSATKYKTWPLDWWTKRMSTPRKNIYEIVRLLERNYKNYIDTIRIERKENYNENELETNIGKWTIYPNNGYFLAKRII